MKYYTAIKMYLKNVYNLETVCSRQKSWIYKNQGNLNKIDGLYECQYPCDIYYSFIKRYHRGKLGKGQKRFSVVFLTTSCEFTMISAKISINKIAPDLEGFTSKFCRSFKEQILNEFLFQSLENDRRLFFFIL